MLYKHISVYYIINTNVCVLFKNRTSDNITLVKFTFKCTNLDTYSVNNDFYYYYFTIKGISYNKSNCL